MKFPSILAQKILRIGRITTFLITYTVKKSAFNLKKKAPHLRNSLESFPALHMKKLGFFDYLLTFSSEASFVALAFLIIGLNLYFFVISPTSGDKSLAGVLLAYHHEDGDKVYGKLAAITTVVQTSNTPFIPEAYAETTPYLENKSSDSTNDETDTLTVNEDGNMVRPNPDSVAALIEKQVKVHTVTQGETLGSIARDSNLRIETIIWANNLPGSTVKPGWQLLIPPVDGILVKADSNTTIPDIAHKYNCSIDTIIAYNGLDGADDIDTGRILIAPGCTMPAPEKPAPKPTPKPSSSGKSSALAQLGKHYFPAGYCTYYVASRMEIDFGGNANNWPANAAAAGYTVTSVPTAGAAVVTTDGPRKYGHVAYVERVTSEYIEVSEMNYVGFNKISTRKIPRGSRTIVKYILPN